MIDIRKISYTDIEFVNQTNVIEYTPFFYNKEIDLLLLENHFYNEIKDTYCEKQILKQFNIQIKDKLEDFEKYSKETIDQHYWKIYRIYAEWYNANHWLSCIDNYEYINLSLEEKTFLVDYCTTKIKSNMYDVITNKINESMERLKSDTGYFVKLSAQSPKHDFAPYPHLCADNVLEYLCASPTINAILERDEDCGVLIKPWINYINSDNEIRVFVINNKVVGISQQMIYSCSNTMQYFAANAHDIFNKIQAIWNYWKDNKKIEYNNAVLDMWIDSEMDPYLIEINAGCVWGCAGSSSFTWKEIVNLAENNKQMFSYVEY